MVKICTTRAGENATAVPLKCTLVCLNCDGHRLFHDGLHKSLLIICGYILVTCDASLGDSHGAAGLLARASSGGVRIALFCAKRVLLSIPESVIHKTT